MLERGDRTQRIGSIGAGGANKALMSCCKKQLMGQKRRAGDKLSFSKYTNGDILQNRGKQIILRR